MTTTNDIVVFLSMISEYFLPYFWAGSLSREYIAAVRVNSMEFKYYTHQAKETILLKCSI